MSWLGRSRRPTGESLVSEEEAFSVPMGVPVGGGEAYCAHSSFEREKWDADLIGDALVCRGCGLPIWVPPAWRGMEVEREMDDG